MTCENLTPRPLFDTEVGQLKARIEALERMIDRDGLTENEKVQVAGIIQGAVPSLVPSVVALYLTQKYDPAIKAFISQADDKVVSLADARAAKIATEKVKGVQQTVNAVNTKVGKISGTVEGLKTSVANNAKKIVENSKTLTKVSNVASSAASKVGALFTKIAPILNIAGFLLNLASAGFTAYALAQLFSRMSAQEKLNAALYAALTFAGGQLLTAAYVASLNDKVLGIERRQEVDTTRIIGHVTAEHLTTRGGIRSAIQSTQFESLQVQKKLSLSDIDAASRERQTQIAISFEGKTTRDFVANRIGGISEAITSSATSIKNLISSSTSKILQAIAGISAGVSSAFQATVITRLDAVLVSVSALQNTMLGKFAKLWDYMKMDRVLNVVTTAAAVHNAAMLSRNLAVSLIDTIGETLGLIGLKDADGNAYDLNSMIGSAAEGLVIRLIGADAYSGLSKNWREANRIISAGAAVVMSIRSAQWALAEGIEIMSSWIAKIGNGLEDEGVVSDRKWPWMRENLNIKSFTALDKINNGLESAEEITDSIYMTVSAGTEISEAVTQMRTSSQNFKNTLDQDENTADQELQNKEVESESPAVDDDDLAEYEPEAT